MRYTINCHVRLAGRVQRHLQSREHLFHRRGNISETVQYRYKVTHGSSRPVTLNNIANLFKCRIPYSCATIILTVADKDNNFKDVLSIVVCLFQVTSDTERLAVIYSSGTSCKFFHNGLLSNSVSL